MKTNKFLVYFGALSLFAVATNSHALITIVSEKRKASKTINVEVKTGEQNSRPSKSSSISKVRVKSTDAKSCSDQNYFPLKLLSVISEAEGNPIEIEDNIKTPETPKKIKIIHQPHLKTCTKFRYEVAQVEGNNTSTLSVVNDYDFDSELKDRKDIMIAGKPLDLSSEALIKMNTNDKYEACLISKGILKENEEGKFELVWPEQDSEYAKNTETFEIAFEEQSPMKVLFGSPLFLGNRYGAYQKWVSNSGVGMDCFKLEDLSEGGLHLYAEEDIETLKYLNICATGSHVQIRDALKSLGNAPELRKILEQALDRELEKLIEENYKRMAEIAGEIIKSKDEDTIRSLSEEYLDKMMEIKKYVIDPAIAKLEELYKKRDRERNVDLRAKLDQEILSLNKLIGQYDKQESKFKTGKLLDKLLEFGLTDVAEDIAEFKLRSSHFANVYVESGRGAPKGRKAKIGPEKAQKQIDQKLAVFSRRAKEAEKAYNAKQGNVTYTREIGYQVARIQAARDNQFKNDVQNIQKNFEACQASWFGFMKSPSRCQYAQKNKDRWVQQAYAKRGNYNRSLKAQMDKYEKFNAWESEGRRKRARENADENGSSGIWDESLGTYGMENNFGASLAGPNYGSSDPDSLYNFSGGPGVGMNSGMGMGGRMGGNPYGGGMGGNPYGGGMGGNPYGGGMGGNPYGGGMGGNPYGGGFGGGIPQYGGGY